MFAMLQYLVQHTMLEVVAYPLQGILLVDVAAAMPSPCEHGDSATDLPFKRLCLMVYVQESLVSWTVTTMVSILCHWT